MFIAFFFSQIQRPDISDIRTAVFITSKMMQRCSDGIDAARKKGQEHRQQETHPLPFRQPVAEQPQPAVRPFQKISLFLHRSILLKSLFSNITRCSMMNPFGLSSEREVFWSSQLVTSERSVTLLSRMIICLA